MAHAPSPPLLATPRQRRLQQLPAASLPRSRTEPPFAGAFARQSAPGVPPPALSLLHREPVTPGSPGVQFVNSPVSVCSADAACEQEGSAEAPEVEQLQEAFLYACEGVDRLCRSLERRTGSGSSDTARAVYPSAWHRVAGAAGVDWWTWREEMQRAADMLWHAQRTISSREFRLACHAFAAFHAMLSLSTAPRPPSERAVQAEEAASKAGEEGGQVAPVRASTSALAVAACRMLPPLAAAEVPHSPQLQPRDVQQRADSVPPSMARPPRLARRARTALPSDFVPPHSPARRARHFHATPAYRDSPVDVVRAADPAVAAWSPTDSGATSVSDAALCPVPVRTPTLPLQSLAALLRLLQGADRVDDDMVAAVRAHVLAEGAACRLSLAAWLIAAVRAARHMNGDAA